MVSSTRSTKRRSSARAIPGAPRQRWYCSVCFEWKRARGSRAAGAGSGGEGAPRGRRLGGRGGTAGRREEALHERHELVVIEVPRGRHHQVRAHVAPVVVVRD